MEIEADPLFVKVVEYSVAASRWRIAARCEDRPQDRARFLRQSEVNRAAATDLLTEMVRAARHEPGRPPSADASGG